MDITNKKIICYGEMLADLFGSIQEGFIPKFGGAPVNTAVGLAKLGLSNVYFLGMIGQDFFGDFLKEKMISYGVNPDYLLQTTQKNTTLAFVSLASDGQRSFSFSRGAHEIISQKDLESFDFSNVALLHFGSLTQTNDICFNATKYLIAQAKQNKTILSYDPNVRLALWENKEKLKNIILETAKQVDILKISNDELEFLTGEKELEAGSKKIWSDNLKLLFITLGKDGAFWKSQTSSGIVATKQYNVVDTTGAGDAFNAGIIYQLTQLADNDLNISDENVVKAVEFANMVAGLSTQKKGAVDSLPTKQELGL